MYERQRIQGRDIRYILGRLRDRARDRDLASAVIEFRTNDGIHTSVVWDRGRKPLTSSASEGDLPLYHTPCT